jgi:hypothetical protein
MPSTPRRWPHELEEERQQICQEATGAAHALSMAQDKIDETQQKLVSNPSLALLMLSEADRFISDALACTERIQRFLAICKSTTIKGRWPSAAIKQRDDALQAAQSITHLLSNAQETIASATHRAQTNPDLTKTMTVDVANPAARAHMLAERIARLMTEAVIGRD